MKFIFDKNILLKLLILSAIVRILTLIFVFEKDINLTNYWEYGALTENFINGKGYSLFYQDITGKIQVDYNENAQPVPSAYMPPGYVLFLSPFFLISDIAVRTNLIFIVQILMSLITLKIIFKLTSEHINDKVAILSSIIYIFYPEFIYSCFSIGPTVFYHFFIISLIYLSLKSANEFKTLIIMSIILSIAIYFRYEIALFWLFIATYKLLQFKTSKFFIPLVISFIILSPWLYRNCTIFGKFPLLSTNTGQNLYRGHNNLYPGAWADVKLDEKISKLSFDSKYEIRRDSFLLNKAIQSIKHNLTYEIKISLEKIIHLFGIYFYDSRSFNPVYLISWFILSLLFWHGFIKYPYNEFKTEILLFMFYHLIIAIAFFVILRYQTMFKIIYIPLAGYGLNLIINKFKKN